MTSKDEDGGAGARVAQRGDPRARRGLLVSDPINALIVLRLLEKGWPRAHLVTAVVREVPEHLGPADEGMVKNRLNYLERVGVIKILKDGEIRLTWVGRDLFRKDATLARRARDASPDQEVPTVHGWFLKQMGWL